MQETTPLPLGRISIPEAGNKDTKDTITNRTCLFQTIHLVKKRRYCLKAGSKKEVTFVNSDPNKGITEDIFKEPMEKESHQEQKSTKTAVNMVKTIFKTMSSR